MLRPLLARTSVALTVLLLCGRGVAAGPHQVTWTNDRLTVHATEAPLGEVMLEVARLSGLEVVGAENLTGLVTAELVDLPLDQALAKLLAGVNYVLQERQGTGRGPGSRLLVRIHSMAGGTPPASTLTGPIRVPGLDSVVAEEASDVADVAEAENEDADSDAELRDLKVEAAQLREAGAFGPKVPVNSLLKAMRDTNDWVRLEALKALGTRPMSVAISTLTAALGDDLWEIRAAAVDILGRATDRESLATVGQLLVTSPDRAVRISALQVVALRASPESVKPLRAALKDEDRDICEAVRQVLAEIERRAQVVQEAR
jgi:hypothetical protein